MAAYDIRDVDRSVKKLFTDMAITFRMVINKVTTVVPVKVIFTSPDQAIQKKYYPSIVIVSGYRISNASNRQLRADSFGAVDTGVSPHTIETLKVEKAVDYWFLIQHIAKYQAQDRIFQKNFFENLSDDGILDIAGAKEWFILENISNMDDYSTPIYRKSYLMRTHLNLDPEIVSISPIPNNGVVLDVKTQF